MNEKIDQMVSEVRAQIESLIRILGAIDDVEPDTMEFIVTRVTEVKDHLMNTQREINKEKIRQGFGDD